MKSYREAEIVVIDLLKHVPKMSPHKAIKIMHSISELCLVKNNKQMYKDAIKTIVEISDIEYKDPVQKAAYRAQLGIAEYESGGEDSSERLRIALKDLRKRGAVDIVQSTVECLGQQVKPRKRLRTKTRIECV